MENGALVEIRNPAGMVPAMFLEGQYLSLKTGKVCSRAGCFVSTVGFVKDLSDADWTSLNAVLKVGWTDEARAGAAAARGGKKPAKKGVVTTADKIKQGGIKEGASLQSGMKKEGCVGLEGKPKIAVTKKFGAIGTTTNIQHHIQRDVTQKYVDGTITVRSHFDSKGKPAIGFHESAPKGKTQYIFNKGKASETGFSNLKEAVSYGKGVHTPGYREMRGKL